MGKKGIYGQTKAAIANDKLRDSIAFGEVFESGKRCKWDYYRVEKSREKSGDRGIVYKSFLS